MKKPRQVTFISFDEFDEVDEQMIRECIDRMLIAGLRKKLGWDEEDARRDWEMYYGTVGPPFPGMEKYREIIEHL